MGPALHATPQDVTDWRALACSLEAEVRVHYEAFLYDRQRCVDDALWAPLQVDDDAIGVATFAERSEHGQVPMGPQAALAESSGKHRFLVAGVVAGSVDDALYGCCFHDTISLRTHETYAGEPVNDSAVYATLEGPTLKDPFKLLVVTWHQRRLGCDWLLLQHTHLTTLSSGERVGVSLRHSIQHRDLPELNDPLTDPEVISTVTFYRDLADRTIEVFSMELCDTKHHERLLSAHACAVGAKKKLVWYFEQQQKRYHPTASLPECDHEICKLCQRSTDVNYGKASTTNPEPVVCHLCAKQVCSDCSAAHDIVVDTSFGEIEMNAFAFCSECLARIEKLPAQRIAREQVLQQRQQL